MKRTPALLIGTAAVLILAGAVAFFVLRGPHGAPTPEEASARYVTALAHHDRGGLVELADPGYASTKKIDQLMASVDGRRLNITKIAIDSSASSSVKRATLTGNLGGEPYSDQLWLNKISGRWYVQLGPTKGPHT